MTKPTQTKLDRRNFLKLAGSALSAAALTACALPIQAPGKQKANKPNFIIIFCDDLDRLLRLEKTPNPEHRQNGR
ncbi:MAG: twin-arginine translocation signal domain-containing protein [Planctomycetota bacterium]